MSSAPASGSGGSRLSLWSTDSLLSIASRGSVLSIGSIGSFGSVASIGSVGSVLSVGSAVSTGSALSSGSRWSLLSDRSFGAAMGSRTADRTVAGAPAALAAVAVAAYVGYLLERTRRRSSPNAGRRPLRAR